MYSIQELSDETGYAPMTIYLYAARGLIPRASHRGPGATWPSLSLKLLRQFKANINHENRETLACLAQRAGLTPKR